MIEIGSTNLSREELAKVVGLSENDENLLDVIKDLEKDGFTVTFSTNFIRKLGWFGLTKYVVEYE